MLREIGELVILVALLPFVVFGVVVFAAHAWAFRKFWDLTEGRWQDEEDTLGIAA